MAIRVGINGFGRIGRNFFRAAKLSGAKIEFVAGTRLLETLAHLLKMILSTVSWRISQSSTGESALTDRNLLSFERNPGDLPWETLGLM